MTTYGTDRYRERPFKDSAFVAEKKKESIGMTTANPSITAIEIGR